MRINTIILYTLFLLISFNLTAADFEISASVDASKIGIEDVLIYTLKIKGNVNIQTPDISIIKDFRIQSTGNSREFMNMNGQMTHYFYFNYTLIPKKTGSFNLPSISFTYDGKTYKTKSFKIEVVKGKIKKSTNNSRMGNRALRSVFDNSFNDPLDSMFRRRKPQKQEIDVFLKTDVSSKTVIRGEQIIYTIYLYARNRITNVNLMSDQSFPGFFQEWKPITGQIEGSRKEFNAKMYEVYEIRKVALFPTKSGELTVPPLKFVINVYDPYSFAFSNSKKIFRTTKKIKINVKKDTGQSGLPVGSYTMKLSLLSRNIDINEILTVNLEIEGVGNIKTLPVPEFAPNPYFKVFEPVVKRESLFTDRGIEGSINSEMTLNFKKKGLIVLPSLNLRIYDPIKKRVVNLKTNPVHIKVSGIKEKNETMVPLQKEIIETRFDITYIKEGRLNKKNSNFYNQKLFYYLLILPFLINIIFILKTFVFDGYVKNSSSLKKRKFFSHIQKKMNLIKEYGDIHSVIEEYFKERSGVGFSDLTNITIETFLVNLKIGESEIKLILGIKTGSESAKFSPQKIATTKIRSDINGLLKVLKKIESRV